MKNKTKYIIFISLFIVSIILLCVSAALTELNPKLWWTVLISAALSTITFIIALIAYLKSVEFFCPKCETQFKAKNKDIILAIHTPTKRYLRCPNCGEKSWCKEIIVERDNHRD